MDNLGEKKEVICLRYRLIFHCIIFALLLIIHIVIYLKIYWMKNIFKLLFLYFSFLGVVYVLVSIIPYILVKIKKLQSKVRHFKIISKIFLFLSLLIGLFFFIIIIINTNLVKDFCIECPFNISFFNFVSNFEKNFENKEEYELKRNCRDRRCLFNKYDENSKYPYSYLCNYDPEDEFSLKDGDKRQLNCKLFEPFYKELYFTDETIYKYIDKCFNLADLYYCGRLQEPKKYELPKDEKCPKKYYMIIMYFLCIYIFIFDVVINIIIWYFQHNSYSLLSRIKFEVTINMNNHDQNINNDIKTIHITNSNKNENNNNQNNNTNNNENSSNQNDNITENNNKNNTNNITKESNDKILRINTNGNSIKIEEIIDNDDFNPTTKIIKNSRNKTKKVNGQDISNNNTNKNNLNTTRPLKQKN